MVGVAGFEPAAHWSQTSCATKLRYTPKTILCVLKKMVSPQGFEPRTHGLEGRCSIQLSYEPTQRCLMERVMRIELTTTAWEAVVLPLNYTRNYVVSFNDFILTQKSYNCKCNFM